MGATVVKVTGRMLKAAMISNPVAQHVRNMFIHIGLSAPFVRQKLTGFLTEESVTLRGSTLCGPGLSHARSQPGDMFPDVAITVSGKKMPASHLLRGNPSTCIVMGDIDVSQIPDKFGMAGNGVALTVVPVGEGTEITGVQDLAAAVGLKQQGLILVRPDNVIAAVGTDINMIHDYMSRFEPLA